MAYLCILANLNIRVMKSMNPHRCELQLARGRIRPLFIRYAVPGVVSMLFMALQALVDGWIVGRLVCADALAGVNITMPIYAIVTAITIVIGVGTQAHIGLHLGERDYSGAKSSLFSGAVGLIVFTVIGTLIINIFAQPMVSFLGADEDLMEYSLNYIFGVMPWLVGLAAFLFLDFQLKALGQPRTAMTIMTCTIILNTTLSLVFVGHLKMGTLGAGLGTGISYTAGSVVYAIYFFRTLRQNSQVSNAEGRFSLRTLGHICYNGSSEGLTEVAFAVVTFLFNITLMRYAGKEGVAAFTLVSNILYFGINMALGVSNGIVPVISYNYGAKNYRRVSEVMNLAIRTNLYSGIFFILVLCFCGRGILGFFLDHSETEVLDMASRGAVITSIAFLFNGFNIFAASYFTAIDRPDLSLLVAGLRGLFFLVPLILILPVIWGMDGIWFTTPIAELGTALVAGVIIIRHIRHLNHYETEHENI